MDSDQLPRIVAIVALLVVAAVAVAIASGAKSVEAQAGEVTATLTYKHDAKNPVATYSDLHLTITRDGRVEYRRQVNNRFCGAICWPNLPHPVRVRDVEADGQPDVLLDLYTGGAHCCNLTEVFRYDPAHANYSSLVHLWGDPGYSLERLDASKSYEFVTLDDRFAYEFTAFAFSGLPLEILRLEHGQLVDVTRAYPALLAKDAASQWRFYRENRRAGTGLGFLAAWAADECNLGRAPLVADTLRRLERADGLRSNSTIWPAGAKFVASLRKFLQQTGYEQ